MVPAPPPARPWVPALVTVVGVLVMVGAGMAGVWLGVGATDIADPDRARAVTTVPPTTAPPTTSAPSVSPTAAAPPPSTTPAPVDASVPCTADTLRFQADGWDSAMGWHVVSVVATHSGPEPCFVDGYADIRLFQGGRPLGTPTTEAPAGYEDVLGEGPRRVGIAPGGTAWFALFWRGPEYRADSETPQSLQVALSAGGAPSEVLLSDGPAPFDLLDGTPIIVGSWMPARY